MLLQIYLIGLSCFYLARLACEWKKEKKRGFIRLVSQRDSYPTKVTSKIFDNLLRRLRVESIGSCSTIVLVGVHLASLWASLVCGLDHLLVVALSIIMPCVVLYSSILYDRRQHNALENQVEPLLASMANSLYGNPAIINALREAKDIAEQPMRNELMRVLTEIDHGHDIASSLRRFSARTGNEIVGLAVDGIIICRETGGNLSRLLESLSSVARVRASLTGKIKALTAQQKTSAIFVTVIPVIFVLFSQALSPTYRENLGTPIGIGVTIYALVSVAFGFVWMERMTNVLHVKNKR